MPRYRHRSRRNDEPDDLIRKSKLKKYHGKSGSGIGVEFSLKAGEITMLSMNYLPNGRFKLVAATGISHDGAIPQTGNTNTRVSFNMPVTEFLRRWCEAGPTHHLALGIGNLIPEIRCFARIMDMELEVRVVSETFE